MRERTTKKKIEQLLNVLGESVDSETRIYLCSGTSIVYWGLRETSLDVDLKVEGKGIGKHLREAKRKLNINIEPEHPGLFIPLLPDWRERSPEVTTKGMCSFYHLDPYSVVVSKLERGEEKDLHDVRALVRSGRVDPDRLQTLFETPSYQEALQEKFDIDIDRLTNRVMEVQDLQDND